MPNTIFLSHRDISTDIDLPRVDIYCTECAALSNCGYVLITGFPYSADVHVLPCNMGGGSLYRYGRFSESVRLSFGEIYNESAHAVEVEVNAILGAGAASVIVKDCLTTTGTRKINECEQSCQISQ